MSIGGPHEVLPSHELERENARLKQLVAEQALDNSIVREVASGNF